MTQLLNWFKNVFSKNTYGHDLENYITSRNPKSTADVEHWERKYNQYCISQSGGF